VRDGVSVDDCNFPVRVPAVPLQSDARETALDSREPRHFHSVARADNFDRADRQPNIDLPALSRQVSKLEVGPNREPITPLDRGPTGTESTDPSVRSAVI
jgi:hypothetical protein